MKVIDWSKIYKKYKGLWVSLKDDEETVVSFGKTLDETLTKAQKKVLKIPFSCKYPAN